MLETCNVKFIKMNSMKEKKLPLQCVQQHCYINYLEKKTSRLFSGWLNIGIFESMKNCEIVSKNVRIM